MTWAQPGTTPYRLPVSGRVLDGQERNLANAGVRIDQDGTTIAELMTDAKGRFGFELDIGNLYGVTVHREGYIRKRFIIDARAEDPSKVITGPFSAEVTLSLESDYADMDITDLYYPFALVTYSKKDKAFIADAAYIAERQKAEAALRLGAARMRKRAAK